MAKLYFRYGAMGSGKTIDLLKVEKNYEEKNKKAFLFTAKIDDRYEEGIIHTRIGLSRPATTFDSETNMYEVISNRKNMPDCILIDEAQFLTKEQVYQLSDIVDYLDIPVICYGLRSDFKQELFEGSKHLLEICDKMEEIKTICRCGKKATTNMRFLGDKVITKGEKIVIGGNDLYEAVCRKCYKKYVNDGYKID